MGGVTSDAVGFAACSIDNGVKLVSYIDVKDGMYGRPFKIRRMKGYEFYIVACVKHLIVLRANSGKLAFMRSFRDVHSDFIYDL